MTWEADTAFVSGLEFFSHTVTRLRSSDWQRPSPCGGWRAVDVLGHVGVAVRFGTQLLLDERPVWAPVNPPGDIVEGNPATWWASLAGPSADATRGVDLAREIDSPMGRRPIGEGLSFPALDLFIHGWDLARSAGTDVTIPAEAIDFAHTVIDTIPSTQIRSPRVFAEPTAPPLGATSTQSFIAWTGRDPLWEASAD